MKSPKVVKLVCSCCVMPENYSGISVQKVGGETICKACSNHTERSFEGAERLVSNLDLGRDEKVGITVSGGKDSLFAWMRLVDLLGPKKVVAFNHNKAGLVHPMAEENMNKASEILGTGLVIFRDESFRLRFIRNLEAFLQKPDAAMVKVALCAGCRYGIRGQMFQEGLKIGIRKFVNANSYLEQNPFKIHLLKSKNGGNYWDGVLAGIEENSAYGHSDNIQVIERDHEYCPSVQIVSSVPDFYAEIQHFSFDRYFPNDPIRAEEAIRERLSWTCPERSWHFDCQIEPFKDIFYYGLLGYTETEAKLSAMIRYGLLDREAAMIKLDVYRKGMQSVEAEVNELCRKLSIAYLLPAIKDFCERSPFLVY